MDPLIRGFLVEHRFFVVVFTLDGYDFSFLISPGRGHTLFVLATGAYPESSWTLDVRVPIENKTLFTPPRWYVSSRYRNT